MIARVEKYVRGRSAITRSVPVRATVMILSAGLAGFFCSQSAEARDHSLFAKEPSANRGDAAPPFSTIVSNEALSGASLQLKEQVVRCWSIPAAAASANMKVTISIELNADGSLRSQPIVIAMSTGSSAGPALAVSAINAVTRCAPYRLPAESYAYWSAVHLTFDPAHPR